MANSFPYWSKILIKPKDMFNNLINQNINTYYDNNNPIVIRNYPDDYLLCDHLSNHFTEKIRINCKFGNKPTPKETWEKIKKDKNYKDLSDYDKREKIYDLSGECNTFNVSYCLFIIRHLVGENKKILDPSSGWGDRLIAALASNCEIYHGFDPNKKLQNGYTNIKKLFTNIKNKYIIKVIPFEEASIKENFYDIAITSPPYFSLEKYGDDLNQSINKFTNYDNWLNNFLKPYLLKMIYGVKKDGYIVIYIENVYIENKFYNLRDYVIEFMNNDINVEYYKKIGLRVNNSKVRYALVWKKH